MNWRKTWHIIVPIILFAMLAICIQAGIAANFEWWAYNESMEEMSPVLTTIMKGITHLGDSTTVITFCLILFAIPKSRKTIVLPVSATVIISAILNVVLKKIFARERPDILRLINETGYSFPSGHAMINASLYTMLILFVFKYIKDTPRKIALSALYIALIIVIGYSRIYLGVHYAGDVLGGWLFGYAISMFIYLIWSNRKTQKSGTSRPVCK